MEKQPTFFVGVDGGGTKTTIVIVSADGEYIKTHKTGACNVAVLKPPAIEAVISDVVAQLPDENPASVTNAVFAFAGAGRPRERELTAEIIKRLGFPEFTIFTDAEILYYAALGDKPGILLSAGTGSICLAKLPTGEFHQIGGRGYLLGDEGSGFYIGNQAIRTAIRDAEDNRPPSGLTRELLRFYGLNRPEELVSIIYTSNNPPNVVASCARLVCESAELGDANARTIINSAAKALLKLLRHGIEHLPKQAAYNVALAGSILQPNGIVEKQLIKLAEQKRLQVHFFHPTLQPAAAAVLKAMRTKGIEPSPDLYARLESIHFD